MSINKTVALRWLRERDDARQDLDRVRMALGFRRGEGLEPAEILERIRHHIETGTPMRFA